ncbi:MAG TPA: sigma 54-interacting transcriptional regulator [Polyangiaceae bacterium]
MTGHGNRALGELFHFEPTSPSRSAPARTRPAALSPIAPEFSAILGVDPALVEAKAFTAQVAVTTLPVLLLAETGAGKELFARAIHGLSDRHAEAWVAVNCGALQPSLIASELFGYAAGSFTGAGRHGSEGRFAVAHGGTLFLDEIAELPLELQATLLRVLDTGTFQRVGETRERRADFRLICATSCDLPALVAAGKFRSELFYRIYGACVTIPALRERTDVVWLAERLLEQLAPGSSTQLADDAARFITDHHWPGNVRELKNAMAHALALRGADPEIRREHLPRLVHSNAPSKAPPSRTRKRIVRDAIEQTLQSCSGNVSEAARRLGVGRGTIYRAVKRGTKSS